MKAGTRMSLAGPFVAVIPEQVRTLGPEAAIVIAHLTYVTHDGPVSLTTADIADGTGLTARTVQRVTTRLRDLGKVASERTSTWDATQRWSVPVSAGHAESARVAVPSLRDGVVTGPRERVVSQTANLAVSPLGLEVEEITPPAPQGEQEEFTLLSVVSETKPQPGSSEAYDAELEPLWFLWPSKRRGGKPNARKAYRAARRRGIPAEVIEAGYRAHVEVMQAKSKAGPDEERWVPHVSSWLNNEGWTQEPPPLPRAPRGNPFADPDLLTRPRTGSDVWGTR